MTDPSTQRPPGWDVAWERSWEELGAGELTNSLPTGSASLIPVRVVRIDKGGITVSSSPGHERLVIAAKAVRRVVVGDVCALDAAAGRIEVILDRRTVFERRAPGSGRDDVAVNAKALAANMDVVLVLQALDAGVNTSRLAREVVLAWESGAQPVVVLTKADLVEPTDLERERARAASYAPEVPVVCVASVTDIAGSTSDDSVGDRSLPDRSVASSALRGTSELEPHLPPGTVAALLGASGAGKSTLVNALAGRGVQLTAEVREGDQRGRHTTTAGQMLPLARDRWLIDTPGIRGVGLWHADEGLERAFADLSPFAQRCRFADCTHTTEPGCGVLGAVAAGQLGADRLALWHELVAEVEQLEAESEELERAHKREANQRSRRRAAAQRGRPRR
jgi:ribosome biogenesis GTPase